MCFIAKGECQSLWHLHLHIQRAGAEENAISHKEDTVASVQRHLGEIAIDRRVHSFRRRNPVLGGGTLLEHEGHPPHSARPSPNDRQCQQCPIEGKLKEAGQSVSESVLRQRQSWPKCGTSKRREWDWSI